MTTGVDEASRDMAVKYGNPYVQNMPANASYTGNQTYAAADLIGGTIVHNASGNVTATLPTAALMRANIPNARIGDTIFCLIVNGAGATGTITLAAGSGGSFDTNQQAGAQVIPQGTSKTVQLRMTNVTPGSEAYVVYC